MREPAECMIAIFRGEVRCAGAMTGKIDWRSIVSEWATNRQVSEIARVPVEVARLFLFKRWPGRDAAIKEATESVVRDQNGGDDA